MTDRPFDPFAPASSGGRRRPYRSTAELTLPSWLLDELHGRGVSDEALAPLHAQFEQLNPSERAAALAELQVRRTNRVELDELADALVEYEQRTSEVAAAQEASPGAAGEAAAVPEGSAAPEPVAPAQEAVSAADVPKNANEVTAWLGDAADEAELLARAQAALDVELGYSAPRKTVLQAAALALGDEHVEAAVAARG